MASPTVGERPARRPLRMVKALARPDAATAIRSLADELLEPHGTSDTAAALDKLRRQMGATGAVLWLCDSAGATCALQAGGGGLRAGTYVSFQDDSEIASRLHASGMVLCRDGELSGLEPLVPPRARSHAAAAAHRDGTVALLVLAWAGPVPPCDRADLGDLRMAAALLASRRPDVRADEPGRLYDAIAGSLASPLLVIDRAGVIVAANAAWAGLAARYPEGSATVVGLDCAAVLREGIGARGSDAETIVAGVEDVLNGRSDSFSTSYFSELAGEERCWVITVTPMRHPGGGAVIEHTALGQPAIDALAQRTGTRIFERLIDTAPVPIWIAALDGRLLYGNAAWADPVPEGGDTPAKWTDAIHSSDRRRAASMFRRAALHRRGFDAELRVRSPDGSYRWWRCNAAPHYTAAGEVDWYIGVCGDATGQRHWKSAFEEAAGKLVAAQEDERIHIARELHDDLGQQIAVVGSKIDMLQAHRARTTKARKAQFETASQIRTAVDQIASTIHALSHRLHPAKLRLLGLVPTIEGLCRDESLASGVEVRCAASDVPEKLPDATELCLFRVAQESVRNALRHSGATTIDVALSRQGAQLTLMVADNGSGFDPASASHGLGLFTMRERVQLVGGDLTVTSSREKGTTITITVPLGGEPQAASETLAPTAVEPLPVSEQ